MLDPWQTFLIVVMAGFSIFPTQTFLKFDAVILPFLKILNTKIVA
jgi:hypothetical protein